MTAERYTPAELDFAKEVAALRVRSEVAVAALENLAAGRGEILDVRSALIALTARCNYISRELALLNLQQPIEVHEPIERPISGDLMAYVQAVEVGNRGSRR